jgi:DNA-binding CsgD family transcriptional regulator
VALALFVEHHNDREIGVYLNHDHKTVKKHLKAFETFMSGGG